jgi:exo-1,4-beta-D-glucosaminidase
VNSAADSSQQVFYIPGKLYSGTDKIFFIDLSLSDATGRVVSRNFYWVPYTLTSFDWARTDYTHTPAERHEDLTALANLPPAQLQAQAEIGVTAHGRQVRLHLQNSSAALAFQVRAAVRTSSGGLIAPVFWSDNWIELTPGEATTLTAELPESAPGAPVVQVEGWNIQPQTITPQTAK